MIVFHPVIHEISSEGCYREDKQGCYVVFPHEGNVIRPKPWCQLDLKVLSLAVTLIKSLPSFKVLLPDRGRSS